MSEVQIDPTAAERKKIINRLRRAHGQLNAVINLVEDSAHCKDIVTQLAAVSKAIDRAGFALISQNMQECLARTQEGVERGENDPSPEELEKLFLMLA